MARFQIITEEALMGGYNHTVIDTKQAEGHRLYERGCDYSRHQSPPQSLVQLARTLNINAEKKVRAYQ